MCNKVPYKTKAEALEDIKRIEARSKHYTKQRNRKPGKNGKLRPYYHNACGNYHLTSQKPKKHMK